MKVPHDNQIVNEGKVLFYRITSTNNQRYYFAISNEMMDPGNNLNDC